jgi:predicted membrane protein
VTPESQRSNSGRELTGLIIILVGFGLLMNTMGIFPGIPFWPIIQRFWLPALFIGIGVLLLSRRGHESYSGGLFFILFGFLFLMSGLNFWGGRSRFFIGPFILIWIGLTFLTRSSRPRRDRGPRTARGPEPVTDASTFVHATVILGQFNRKCPSQQFRGGDLTAIMGGGKLDLRGAHIEDDEAVLDIFMLMGGLEIQVPRDWTVEQRFTPIMGGFEDRTNPEKQATQRLAIHGTAIMGGVIVSN